MGWYGPQGGDCSCCESDTYGPCDNVIGSWDVISGSWTSVSSGWRNDSPGIIMFTPSSGVDSGDKVWWRGSFVSADAGYIFDAIDEDNCHRIKAVQAAVSPYVYVLQDVTAGVVTDLEEFLIFPSSSPLDFLEVGSYFHVPGASYTANIFCPRDGSYAKKGGNKFGLFYEGSGANPIFSVLDGVGDLRYGRHSCFSGKIDTGSPDSDPSSRYSLFPRNNGIRVYNSFFSGGTGTDPGGKVTAELNVSGFTLSDDYECTSVTDPCTCDDDEFAERFFGPFELANYISSAFTTEYRALLIPMHNGSPSVNDCRNRISGTEIRWSGAVNANNGGFLNGLYITNAQGFSGEGYGVDDSDVFDDLPAEIFKLTYFFILNSDPLATSGPPGQLIWRFESPAMTLAEMMPGQSKTLNRVSQAINNPSRWYSPGTWSGGDQVTIYFEGP